MALDFGRTNGTQTVGINNNVRMTSMNLAKTVIAGERINLSKTVGAHVTRYAIGLNWNTKPGINADCDLSIILMKNGTVIPSMNGPNQPKCMVYYGQLEAVDNINKKLSYILFATYFSFLSYVIYLAM